MSDNSELNKNKNEATEENSSESTEDEYSEFDINKKGIPPSDRIEKISPIAIITTELQEKQKLK